MAKWLDNIKNSFTEKAIKQNDLDNRLLRAISIPEQGSAENAKLLIDKGAKPDSNMLLCCVQAGYTPMARLLIDNNAEPNQEMLRIALEKKDKEMAMLLMSKGIKPNQEMADYIKKQENLKPLLN